MRTSILIAIGFAGAIAAACSATSRTTAGETHAQRDSTLDRAARADSVRHSYTQADVDFMAGMIHHHAQALVMAEMAPTHDASPSLRIMAERIFVGQNDEIALMQRWLRDHGQPVPDPAAAGPHDHHGTHMPGMLSAAQMAELDAARGSEFDRLFLTYMIQHHQGAITMVEELFASHGGAQGDAVFKLASDIAADQDSEIARMRSMLREMMFQSESSP
ncbi:MAG TPA: DUF305 domain-containing protein [Gemmatimonadota bacterium]|nr:DUF305 domain-containing protein [Gemmatimonadota bacterium]